MFYTNQSIHHPDSPRHMDVGSWANEHTVALRNQFDPRHVAVNGFDVTPYIDQIEQGVVALFPVTRNESLRGFRFIYKLPKGMYEQQGFGGGSITIPVPELYISAYVELNFGSAGVRVNDVTMELGVPHIKNIYHCQTSTITVMRIHCQHSTRRLLTDYWCLKYVRDVISQTDVRHSQPL